MYKRITAQIVDDDFNYLRDLACNNGLAMGTLIADAVAEYVRRSKTEAAVFQVIIDHDEQAARFE